VKIFLLGGGIASGKSTVARAIRQAGGCTVDADQLARRAVAQGTDAFREIKAQWPSVINSHGALDRAKLGEIVFADARARKELEEIVHPEVWRLQQNEFAEMERRGWGAVFYETPLLLKTMESTVCDAIIVAHAPLEERIRRIMSRDNVTEREAKYRIAAQPSQDELLSVATYSLSTISRAGCEAGAKTLFRTLTAE
jgi:dephospho-CoA kinase